MNPERHNKRPLTTRQAAEYLSLSKYTLECWRSRGEGPKYLKLGRSVRYRIEDLDAFMQSSITANTTVAA